MVALSADALVVFALVAVALVLFVTEVLAPDVTAIGVLVTLAVLGEFTHVDPTEAVSGFANAATVTILAMYILSEGIRQTGIVTRFSRWLVAVGRGSDSRLLGAILGTTGLAAGFVNNTPIVAVFIPMITDLAAETDTSPSKLLLPLSYAAMLGGTLTLIGTATNLLVSDIAARTGAANPALGLHALSMFEFTPVGLVVFVVGVAYLMTVGRWLVPARVEPAETLTRAFDVERHLAQVAVRETSPLVGTTVAALREVLRAPPATETGPVEPFDLDVIQLVRGEETFHALSTEMPLEAGDLLTVRGNRREVNRFTQTFDLRQRPRERVTAGDLDVREGHGRLVEVFVPEGSRFAGETVREANLAAFHSAQVLAVRRGDTIVKDDVDAHEIGVGDSLLVQVRERDLRYLVENGDVVVTRGVGLEEEPSPAPEPLGPGTPIVLGTVALVVAVAALGLLPISIAALGGVVVLFATGTLSPSDAYAAVNWNVIFLLAGLLPLGLALSRTGGDAFIAELVVTATAALPPIAVLGAVYLLTGVFAALITPVASVVLLAPIAIDVAVDLGVEPLSFVLVVLFGASTAFATPVGYQTNLMVYGPGGYRFTDYLRVGVPLQLLLAVVTTVAVALYWGL